MGERLGISFGRSVKNDTEINQKVLSDSSVNQCCSIYQHEQEWLVEF